MPTPLAEVTDLATLPVDSLERIDAVFAAQRGAYSAADRPSAEERVDRIERLERLLQGHYRELTATLEADFGYRSPDQILAADRYPGMAHAAHVRRHLRGWMRPRRKSSGTLGPLGVRTRQYVEPLGVVGVMSPSTHPSASPSIPPSTRWQPGTG